MGSGVDNPEGIDINVSSTNGTVNDADKQPSVEDLGKNVAPSVRDTVMEDDVETPEEAGQEKKKSKKRKHKKGAEGEASKPKKKLSKEECVAKRVRRAERKAKKAAEKIVEEHDDGSDEEDIAAVIIKRRKAKGNLKINEKRSRVGNKRIPKNIVVVSTENVALNSEEEEAKWKLVASRRIAAEQMPSENTKKMLEINED
ncbi:hypothetical protein LIER_44061 [Lithospermum erythrorhizon]|uniref:Uncharacterized protein n=1 Tax=Lithospermum erythrorhizon TaxID=34254 RepID=A0AAV3NZP5_LITER